MRVDSGSEWKEGSFSRFYKMFHFVEISPFLEQNLAFAIAGDN